MKYIKGRIVLLLLLLVIWCLLTFPFDIQELLAGAVISLIIVLIPLPGRQFFSDLRINPKSPVFLIAYIFVFLYCLIKSNLDVAFRVLHPKLPIKPGIIKIKTGLRSKMGRIILANSITLTPGTITVDVKDDILYVHWIFVESQNIDEPTRCIAANFEKYLEVIFG